MTSEETYIQEGTLHNLAIPGRSTHQIRLLRSKAGAKMGRPNPREGWGAAEVLQNWTPFPASHEGGPVWSHAMAFPSRSFMGRAGWHVPWRVPCGTQAHSPNLAAPCQILLAGLCPQPARYLLARDLFPLPANLCPLISGRRISGHAVPAN